MSVQHARFAWLLLAAGCLAEPARALPPAEKDWEIDVSAYGWLASISSTVGAEGVQTDIDVPFKDILDNLGWAAMGFVEGRFKRALLGVDFIGMQVVENADENARTRDFALPGGGTGQLTYGGYDLKTRLTTWAVTVTPGFRVLSLPVTDITGGTAEPDDRRRLDLDLFLGFRYWNIADKTSLSVDPASLEVGGMPVPLPPGGLLGGRLDHVHLPGEIIRNGVDRTIHGNYDWFDPVVGARVAVGVTKRWTVFARGDVGGFNIFDKSSDITWQGMLGSAFAVSEHVSLTSGYRALGANRSLFEKTILHGPQIGVLLRF